MHTDGGQPWLVIEGVVGGGLELFHGEARRPPATETECDQIVRNWVRLEEDARDRHRYWARTSLERFPGLETALGMRVALIQAGSAEDAVSMFGDCQSIQLSLDSELAIRAAIEQITKMAVSSEMTPTAYGPSTRICPR